MKKTLFSLSLLVMMGIYTSCSTNVDLYADYKDIPIVYGLLDVTQDTNFIRINRAFSSSNDNPINALEVALIADSCNYPGKLNAKIYRLGKTSSSFSEYTIEDSVALDTMTLLNKQEGIFYSPDQKVYYTVTTQGNQSNAFFKTNTAQKSYKYKLVVLKGNDIVTSETSLVGGEEFKIAINRIYFTSEPTDKVENAYFRLAENAMVYDMKMRFDYQELRNGQLTDKCVEWSLGAKSLSELSYDDQSGLPYYSVSRNALFTQLGSAIGGDTINVVRYFDNQDAFVISLAAGGDELYNYIQVNNTSSSYTQNIPDYTNVKGGYGVFSSRINIQSSVTLSPNTQRELFNMPWGFVQR